MRAAAFLWAGLLLVTWSVVAHTAPQAHILRIDPRAALTEGEPIVTTVVALGEHKPLSDIRARCASLAGNAELDCLAEALVQPHALFEPVAFPENAATLLVDQDGRDTPLDLVGHARLADARKREGMGTAWLLLVDAAGQMGPRFDDAKTIADAFVTAMRPNDRVQIMFFTDVGIAQRSGWLESEASAHAFLRAQTTTYPRQARSRAIAEIISAGATEAIVEIQRDADAPVHQALVVLSNGDAGAASAPVAAALAAQNHFSRGRFSEVGGAKWPLPTVSIWLPTSMHEEVFQQARALMENLANPELGGAFHIVPEGQVIRAAAILKSVTARFDALHVVRWKMPCIDPDPTHSFKLLFRDTSAPIAGDGAFSEVSLGVDSEAWPLDVDVGKTEAAAEATSVRAGGRLKVFGRFCWGADRTRARLYAIPANADPIRLLFTPTNLIGQAVNVHDDHVELEILRDAPVLTEPGARVALADMLTGRHRVIAAERWFPVAAQPPQPPGVQPPPPRGCACGVADRSRAHGWAWLVALIALRGRRRARR